MRVGGVSVSDGLRGATLFRSVGRPPGGILAKAAHVARRRDGISRHALCLFCPVATHRRVSGSMAPDTHGLFASRALSDRRAGRRAREKHPDVARCYSRRAYFSGCEKQSRMFVHEFNAWMSSHRNVYIRLLSLSSDEQFQRTREIRISTSWTNRFRRASSAPSTAPGARPHRHSHVTFHDNMHSVTSTTTLSARVKVRLRFPSRLPERRRSVLRWATNNPPRVAIRPAGSLRVLSPQER